MIVFLDIDGTYADRGVVPEAHVDAVRSVRAEGHHVLLCTGRPSSLVPESMLDAGFDGLVASAGAFVSVGGQVRRDIRFPAQTARRTVEVLDSCRAAYVLESPVELHGPQGLADRLDEVFSRQIGQDGEPRRAPAGLRAVREGQARHGASFNKVTVFDSPVSVDDIAFMIGAEVSAVPSSMPFMKDSAGDLYLTGVHKADGAALAAEAFGLSAREAVAVGDGLNDLEVLDWAGLGVAIEGAPARLLEVADRVCAGPGEAGLVGLFAALGLSGASRP